MGVNESNVNTIAKFEEWQEQIEQLQHDILPYREGRRSVAMALTKLDEARLWLSDAALIEAGA